jgi:transposase InsO family protein
VSHSRAKLNALGRQLLIARIGAGWSMRAAARAQGLSPARASVLWHRFIVEGPRAYSERSSRPHHSPRRVAIAIERRIERARRRLRQGPLRLSWVLGIARSTIYAVLRRLGLNHRRVFAPPRPVFRRYERARPGDLVHIDTKKVGRLPEGGGKRFDAAKHSKKSARIGWEYVHVAVDDRTRVQYSERLHGEDGGACTAFLGRALLFFADHGVRVRQVMTDNAFSYIHSRVFATVLRSASVAHVRIPPYTPRWNGKAEAFIGILLREWAYARPYASNRSRAAAFAGFSRSYNYRRIHGELGGLTPMQRLCLDVHNVRGQHT